MFVYDLVDPADLTSYAREVPFPSNYDLNTILPDQEIQDVEYEIETTTRTNTTARFRAYDAETPIGKRPIAQQTVRGMLPPIGQKLQLGELQRILLERARGANTNRLIDQAYSDTATNVRAIRARMELARGDVLTDGKFTLTGENGLTLEVDFGVPAGNIVAPGTLWSNLASSTPLSDELVWVQDYLDLNGEAPGRRRTSTRVLNYLVRNAEYRAAYFQGASSQPTLTPVQLNQIRSDFNLPPIEVSDTKVDVDGTTTRVIPDDRFLMLPANASDLGNTKWGITAEGLELVNEQNPRIELKDAPGIVALTLKTFDAVSVWSKATAVGMPVLANPSLLKTADVA